MQRLGRTRVRGRGCLYCRGGLLRISEWRTVEHLHYRELCGLAGYDSPLQIGGICPKNDAGLAFVHRDIIASS